jgi:predicted outer membrane repeat protein
MLTPTLRWWQRSALLAALSILVSAANAYGGGIIYVDDDAPPGGNGQSWNTAFRFLRDALTVANDPEPAISEVRIAQGTYRPDRDEANPDGSGDEWQSFVMLSGRTLRGGYAGLGAPDPDALDPKKFITTLNGDLSEQNFLNSKHIVICTGDPRIAGPLIEGLVITHSQAINDKSNDCLQPPEMVDGGGVLSVDVTSVITGCTFVANMAICRGGAFYGSGVISQCVFQGNSAGKSGGGAIYGSVSIDQCVFIDNESWNGGAVRLSADTTVTDCTFIDNHAVDDAGAALVNSNISCDFINCSFIDNGADDGGAVQVNEGGLATFVACRFLSNSSGSSGGAANLEEGDGVFVNCVFAESDSGYSAITTWQGGTVSAVNCTFVANSSDVSAGGAATGTGVIANSIFLDNTSEHHFPEHVSGDISVMSSCFFPFQEGIPGTGNIFVDPLLVDADGPDDIYGTEDDDLHLTADSPCINTGVISFLPADEFDLDKDGDTSEPIPFDLDGLPRIVGSSVDMGAYEFQQVICAADIVPPGGGNGEIEAADLAELLAQWGPCDDPGNCSADIFPPSGGGDGIVGPGDLGELLAQWGACE